jgi:two-component system NtrC family response regulator
VHCARAREEAVDLVRQHPIPVAIIDLGLPPIRTAEGSGTLAEILTIAASTKVIIATGNETREHAVRAIALGAYGFYRKSIDIDVLQLIVSRAEQMFDLESENRRLLESAATSPIDGIIANSPHMMRVLRNIEKIAPTDVTVMLLGESGTGKELLAQAIHKLSKRAPGPFVPINCAAIPETLLESELFGYEKGAFIGAVKQTIGKIESADHRTLFLDEIGDVPLSMQVKLLRFLQDQVVERVGGRKQVQVDVRIVCATNQDLDLMMADGRFREDLYYRLNEVTVRVPPLRDRSSDAVVLASFFLRRLAAEYGRSVRVRDGCACCRQGSSMAGKCPRTRKPRETGRRHERRAVDLGGRAWSFRTSRGAPIPRHKRCACPRRKGSGPVGSGASGLQSIQGCKAARGEPAHTL